MVILTGRDLIMMIVILFVSAFFFFMLRYIGNTLVDKMQTVDKISSVPEASNVLESTKTNITNRLDYLFFGLFIGLILVSIIVSWLVAGIPIFVVLYIMVWILSVILSALFSNMWQDISGASVFGSNILAFPLTNHVMVWLPLYITVVGFIGIIVMFAKPYFNQQ